MSVEIQKRFEEAARYDDMMVKVFPGYEQLPLIILASLRTRLGDHARVLDVGCGTGKTLAAFAAHQPGWSLVGVDPAEPMLELARRRLDGNSHGASVELVHGTVDSLPDEPHFDAATAVLVEHLLPDNGAKLHLLEATQRRIAPGGWLILAGLHGNLQTSTARDALESWLEFGALQGLPKPAQDNVRHRATVEDSLIPEERILELLEEAGFVEITRFFHVQLLGGWIARKPASKEARSSEGAGV